MLQQRNMTQGRRMGIVTFPPTFENASRLAKEEPSTIPIRILMIDDHPSQIEGYKVILSYNEAGFEIQSTQCYTCESAYKIISDPHREVGFDIIFLDSNLPPYLEKNINSGEDLVPAIRKHLPDSKIVIITSHSEAFLLYNIVKKIDPAGLLVKSDFSAEDLLVAFSEIVHGENYHSETVKGSIKTLLAKEMYLDSFNRQMILLLSQGIRTKNLPDYLNISLSAVEKRKAQIKDYFCIEKGNDEDIVREAKRLGFI